MKKEIPKDLEIYVVAIQTLFLESAKRKAKDLSADYFWKWTYTGDIAERCNVSMSKARRDLTKLEKLGIVQSERRPNYIRWGCIPEGWFQHKYSDYLCKTTDAINSH